MNAIIVDDEPLAREGIRMLANNVSKLNIMAEFASAADAMKYMKAKEVDLVFLDINMPGLNGLEFAEQLPSKALVIFTTAYPQYALEGFELDAVDYLVKPIAPERFERAVGKAISYSKLLNVDEGRIDTMIHNSFVFVKADRKYVKVALNDVLVIEGLKDYVVLHVGQERIITALNLKTIYQQLPENIFFRISKSYVVNVTKIESFDHYNVIVNDTEIPIGKNYRDDFFERYVKKRLLIR